MLVEPTRSQNITVRFRRSPTASATGAAGGVGADGRARAAATDRSGWFTEGFDTLDLKEAKVLLEELAA